MLLDYAFCILIVFNELQSQMIFFRLERNNRGRKINTSVKIFV